ncbi:ATP-binding cassette domain-containing protein [bacterium]|nr:ATP-binding cassette domain-containing protein [bacterium]
MSNKKIIFNDNNIAINIEHLFSIYNEGMENQIVSLCDNNVKFEKNKIHYIIGNSGSGKSTLVNHFNGLLHSKYGNVYVQNNYKIGNDLFINDLLIGVVDEKSTNINKYLKINKKDNFQNGFIVAFAKSVLKKYAKILFEAYYKVKIKSIKKIKSYSQSDVNFFYLLPIYDEYKININDKVTISKIKNQDSNNKITKNEFIKKVIFSKKKINKIKNLKKTVGIVFQFPEYQLFKDTIINDVMFGPINLGINKKVANESATKYLELLGINKTFFQRSPFDLSGGQKRRVAIAGVLAFNPNILIFDEPTVGLDPLGEKEILNLIQNQKNDGKTIIVISHNMDHVLETADNVVVMNDGEIIKIGTPYEIFKDQELMQITSIDKPKIIEIIDALIAKDETFKLLYELKPRTINELSDSIEKIIKS